MFKLFITGSTISEFLRVHILRKNKELLRKSPGSAVVEFPAEVIGHEVVSTKPSGGAIGIDCAEQKTGLHTKEDNSIITLKKKHIF